MAARVIEFFGYDPCSDRSKILAEKKRCPFVRNPCIKPRLGACSIKQTNAEPVIICPNRLYAKNHRVLQDIAEQAFGKAVGLQSAEVIAERKTAGELDGTEVAVFGKYWGQELSIPQPTSDEAEGIGGFYIDYVLAWLQPDGEVREFTAVEIQTIDTTGSYAEQSNSFFEGKLFEDKRGNVPGWSSAGLNWANVSKRILPQLIYKGYVLRRERLCGKGLFFVCPTAVLDRIKSRLGTKMLDYPIAAGTITLQAYDLGASSDENKTRPLIKGDTFTTTVEQVAYAFVSPVNLPAMGVYEKAITRALNRR